MLVLLLCKAPYSSRIFVKLQWWLVYPSGLVLDILCDISCTEEWIFLNKQSIFFVVLGDHRGNCASKGLSIDKP